MRLKPNSLETLKQILRKDYGADLSDEEADRLGLSLLKVANIAVSVFNRNEENNVVIIN